MTTKTRELSIDRYTFYTSQANPLAEEKIAERHGMSLDELEDWKAKNGIADEKAAAKEPIKQVAIEKAEPAENILTKDLYQQYKSGPDVLADNAIAKKHGMSIGDMQKFKRQNDLIGKFNAKSKASAEVKVEVDPAAAAEAAKAVKEIKPLREKEIAKTSLSKAIQEFEASKKAPEPAVVLASDDEPAIGSLSVGAPPVDVTAQLADKKVNITAVTGKWVEAPKQMERVEIPEIMQLKQEIKKLQENKVWFEERHMQDGERFYKLEFELQEANKQRYAEIKRGNDWCDRYRDLEAENLRLKAEMAKQDELLVKAAKNEQLLFMTMNKATELYGRVLEVGTHE